MRVCSLTSRGTAGFLDQSESASEVEIVLGDLRDGDAVSAAVGGTEIISIWGR